MTARDDYPVLAALTDEFLPHQPEGREAAAMFDEIDRLRTEVDALIQRRDQIMRRSGEALMAAERTRSIARSVANLAVGEVALSKEISLGDAPCEYCGERIVDHAPSELRSCVADLEAREQEADAIEWWRKQQ